MPTNLYNASVQGVAGLVPHRRIDAQSEPSDAQVEAFLQGVEGQVAAAISAAGAMPVFESLPGDLQATFRTAARMVVELGAAALTEAAAHPEDVGAGSYFAVLQARYDATVASLPKAILEAAREAVSAAGPAQARSYPAIRRTLDAPWLADVPPSALGPNPRRF